MNNSDNNIDKQLIKESLENTENKKLKDYKNALKLSPNDPSIYNNLGISFIKLRKFQEALKSFKKAIDLQPNFEIAHNNLGNAFQELNQYQQAVSCYQKAIDINPSYAVAHYNLGNVLVEIGKTRDAISSYKNAIKYDSKHSSTRHNLSRAQLAIDDFKNGWEEYELRDGGTQKFYKNLGISKEKIWDGNKFDGSLIVCAEQGVGDEILYSSVFSDLSNYQKDLIVSADERLISLFERSFPKIKFISRKKIKFISNIKKISKTKNSKHILAGSLGKFFRNSLKDFRNNQNPWFVPNMKRVEELKKYFYDSKKIKVGLSWKSTAKTYKDKNVSLIDLANIFPDNYFKIINLQYGDIKSDKIEFEEKTKRKLIHFDNFDYTNDLEGLVALIWNCDLVVSISNATVHFAGALGKLTWVLTPTPAQWYWHFDRKKCLWYPNVKLFRQKNKGERDYVFDQIKAEVSLKYIKK